MMVKAFEEQIKMQEKMDSTAKSFMMNQKRFNSVADYKKDIEKDSVNKTKRLSSKSLDTNSKRKNKSNIASLNSINTSNYLAKIDSLKKSGINSTTILDSLDRLRIAINKMHDSLSRLGFSSEMILDSIYKSAKINNQINYSDSIDSVDEIKLPVISAEVLNVQADKFPDSIEVKLNIFDDEGRYLYGMAPPFYKDSGDYKKYWPKLIDSCSGISEPIKEFSVTEVQSSTSKPYAMAFVLDYSGSMGTNKDKLFQAMKDILPKLKRGDMVSVFRFADKTCKEYDLTSNKKTYIDSLSEIPRKKIGGGTNFFPALIDAINEVNKAPNTHDKFIVAFTDGSVGKISDSALTLARNSRVSIYTIAYGMAEPETMEKIAKKTGGKFFWLSSVKQFFYVFRSIYFSLNNYYKIVAKPYKCDGKHKVSVYVDLPEIPISGIRGDGYYTRSYIMSETKKGSVVKLDIKFDYNKSVIRQESLSIIEKIAKDLLENPDIEIQINGHTDDQGEDKYNLKLSKERAASVKNKLIELGINSSRLKSEGFGESSPLVPNDTEENRQINRRTEIIIIKN